MHESPVVTCVCAITHPLLPSFSPLSLPTPLLPKYTRYPKLFLTIGVWESPTQVKECLCLVQARLSDLIIPFAHCAPATLAFQVFSPPAGCPHLLFFPQ